MSVIPQTICEAYNSTLKSLQARGGKADSASKQRALRIVAKRFRLPIGKVKHLVRSTTDPEVSSAALSPFFELVQLAEKAKPRDRCELCGSTEGPFRIHLKGLFMESTEEMLQGMLFARGIPREFLESVKRAEDVPQEELIFVRSCWGCIADDFSRLALERAKAR